MSQSDRAAITSTRYQRLDEAIIKHIREKKPGHPVNNMALVVIVNEMAAAGDISATVSWRVIDRRLQAMRRAGVLSFEKGADGGPAEWRVVEALAGGDNSTREKIPHD